MSKRLALFQRLPSILFLFLSVIFQFSVGTRFGISYPPVSDVEQTSFTQNILSDLDADLIRYSVHWKLIEPSSKGNFLWSNFEARLGWAFSAGLDPLLTVESMGPDWACDPGKKDSDSCVFLDNQDLKDFVVALLARFPGQISRIQFGNEMLSPSFYIGTQAEFIAASNAFYDAVKEASPTTTVVLGGFATLELRFLAGCEPGYSSPVYYGGEMLTGAALAARCDETWVQERIAATKFLLSHADYDIIDMHLYDDVEYWSNYVSALLDNVDPPPQSIIVSEFGGPMVYDCAVGLVDCLLAPTEGTMVGQPYSDEYHSERMVHFLRTISTLEVVSEAYSFTLVEINETNRGHAKSGLIGLDLEPKPAYFVFRDRVSMLGGGKCGLGVWWTILVLVWLLFA